MVEVHCAHGYLVSTFISQRTNHRTDEFGGCFENRMRLPRLIIENIRRKTGGSLPILCRINASDEVEGGQSVQDAAAVAAYLEQECGVAALHVTRGRPPPRRVHVGPRRHPRRLQRRPGDGDQGGGVRARHRRGRFTEPPVRGAAGEAGRADLTIRISISIADPELPAKARTGRLEELAPCIGCLLGCVPNMFAGRPITCAVNPCVGREAELTPAEAAKRVVVVGGGPGGLYAAWACAVRGHQVTLLEKEPELGGNFRIASYPTGKGQLSEAIRSLIVKCQKAGVDLRCGVEADEALLRSLAPDAVILATGSTPLVLPIPGLDTCGYVTAQAMLEGRAPVGRRVLVVGGGMVGCEAAEYLAEPIRISIIVEMKDEIAADVTPENRRYMFANFEEHHVLLRPNAKVGRFYPDGVDYTLADGTAGSLRGYDSVVLAMGSRPNAALKEAAENLAAQVFVIGEAARAPGNAVLATGDALDAALEI